jgi:hypothetical protein
MAENHTPTPRWCEPDVSGVHNSNLPAATVRIVEGGSWKKQDTVILMPAAKMVPTKCALSWQNLLTPPNQSCPRIGLLGMEIGEAYSTAIEGILANAHLKEHRFILTIEADNTPPPDGLLKLLARMEAHPEFACIGGLYWTKGPGGVPQIWGDRKDPSINFRPQPPDPKGGLVECYGTGMGFNLWRTEMFKNPKLRKPWFRTLCSSTEGVGTQDLYAWGDFQKNGYRCAIDCSVLVGHYDVNADITW